MLAELDIENVALVEHASLSLANGLNILTGETGAGKSLVVEALGFLLGGTLKDKPLRAGATSGCVSARFVELSGEVRRTLVELGLGEETDNEVIISRDFKVSGRSNCRINSRLAPLAVVKQMGQLLVDWHGQHQQYALLKASGHLKVLDQYMGAEHEQALQEYGRVYREARELIRELEELRSGERERLRQIDWSSHEADEIDSLNINLAEDGALEERIKVLAASEELEKGAYAVCEHLDASHGARATLGRAQAELERLRRKDSKVEPFLERITEATIIVNELAYDLTSYAEEIISSPEELDRLQARHEELKRLQRKYGPTLEEVLAYGQRARKALEELSGQGQRSEELEAQVAAICARRDDLARELSLSRQIAARLFAAQACQELAKVGMPTCRFEVSFTPLPSPGPEGSDSVEFLIAPNPGSPPRPLIKIASGGELSRIMLALLCLLSEQRQTEKLKAGRGSQGQDQDQDQDQEQENASLAPTMFFDEIDAGLGGRAAESVARRLQALALHRQVVCVTHLAGIAACGQNHVHLSKEVKDGQTTTSAAVLSGEEREAEIARMLSGDASMQESLRHARCLLLELAGSGKQ